MKIDVLTLFPEMFVALDSSLIGKAKEKGLFELNCHNIRDYSQDKHKKCDDTPFGGGAGMVMTPQPIHDCIKAVDENHSSFRIYMSPRGKRLDQNIVKKLSE
ncbi:MAG: tRNA (guanosine(37)-N1)-methyltransferase TrmD, partial [Clostridia bacterium]|nr:tRNA (guanosine(37)-N1)-methyltransferase TrmD [Clostridia bacterium]